LILGGLVLISYAFVLRLETSPLIYTVGFTLFYVGSAALLSGMLLLPVPRNPVTRLFNYVGVRSYSIYLWHVPALLWTPELLQKITGQPAPFMLKAIVYLVGSFLLGIVAANAIELPVMRLRDRWFPSKAPLPADEATMSASTSKCSAPESVAFPPPAK
jgi:peptidoglycan/LPS O-acetylase OafA/YrhL